MPRLSNPQCGRLRFAPVLSAGICACLSSSFVHAADFIVPTGTTAGQQILSGIGDTGLIEAGGVIASPVIGVLMNNADQAVTNLGLISTTGFFASGVGAYGTNAEINNLGAITTTGTVGIGIFATAGNVSIYNGGHISTSGVFGVGVA